MNDFPSLRAIPKQVELINGNSCIYSAMYTERDYPKFLDIFHDAEFLSVSWSRSSFEARLLLADRSERVVKIQEIYDFVLFSLKKKNTLEGIYFESISEKNVREIVEEFRKLSFGVALLGNIEEIERYILTKCYELIVFEPSEGAGILVLAKRNCLHVE